MTTQTTPPALVSTEVRRGRTTTYVTVEAKEPLDPDVDVHEAVVEVALAAARETRTSLFGWSVRGSERRWSVDLWTD